LVLAVVVVEEEAASAVGVGVGVGVACFGHDAHVMSLAIDEMHVGPHAHLGPHVQSTLPHGLQVATVLDDVEAMTRANPIAITVRTITTMMNRKLPMITWCVVVCCDVMGNE
jgi:hypothetical protein